LTSQIVKNLLIVFIYHSLLIVLPINFFLIALKAPFILNIIPWFFYSLLVLSPVLTVIFAFRSTPSFNHQFNWIFPITFSLIGYAPLIISYFSFTSLSSIRDCLLVFLFPISIGLLSYSGAWLLNLSHLHSISNKSK